MPRPRYQRVKDVPQPERIRGRGVQNQRYQKINMSPLENKTPPEVRSAQAKARLARFKQVLKDNW